MIETNETYSVPDDFYRAFEDRFRGSQELISERLEVYVPVLRALRDQRDVVRSLDLGCGRGEWLQLLKREGFEAHGVDLDEGMLQAARANGLSVENKDAIAALLDTDDASLDLVTGFHIIEHLAFPTRLALIREAYRALRPGGLLILETPNPENIQVGTWSFHLDPTHVAPIPPMLLQFLAEYAGFVQNVILRLHAPHPSDDPTLLDVYTKVAGDYALVARTKGPENAQMDQVFNTDVGLDIFGALNRYDALLQEGIAKELTALQARYDALLRERITKEMAAIEARYDALLRERITKEMAAIEARCDVLLQERIAKEVEVYHRHIHFLYEEIEWMKTRRLGQALFFRRSGRPTKLVRWVAFHKNGRPRGGILRRIALRKDGTLRPAFSRWMSTTEYGAQLLAAANRSQDAVVNAVSEATVLEPTTGIENMRGPDPRTHTQRYQIWARLDSAQRLERN